MYRGLRMTLEASQLYQQAAVDQPPAKQNYIIKIGVRSFFSHQVAFLACRYQPSTDLQDGIHPRIHLRHSSTPTHCPTRKIEPT